MPLAWLHIMSKQQLKDLASQQGLKADGTLDDLRRSVKEKWTAIEPFLPSPSTATKSTIVIKSEFQIINSLGQDSSYANKMKIKLIAAAMKNNPFLAATDTENVLKFLMAVKGGGHDLNVVADLSFISLLVSRTSGR
jgi:hypothetical protein